MNINEQKLKVADLLRKALAEDEKNKGGFSGSQYAAWNAYDDALAELGKMLATAPASNEMPEVGGEPMGSFHPPEPTKPAFDGLTKGEYFARKTARQNATKVKGK